MYEGIKKINRAIMNKVPMNLDLDNSFETNQIKIEQLGDKALELFKKCIDEESATLLTELIKQKDALVTNLEERTGWLILRSGACYLDNYMDINSTNESKQSYFIPRNEKGFYLKTDRYNFKKIRSKEIKFYVENHTNLNRTNDIMCQIEQIMGGNYKLRNDSMNAEYVSQLAEALGYKQFDKVKDKCRRL